MTTFYHTLSIPALINCIDYLNVVVLGREAIVRPDVGGGNSEILEYVLKVLRTHGDKVIRLSYHRDLLVALDDAKWNHHWAIQVVGEDISEDDADESKALLITTIMALLFIIEKGPDWLKPA